MFRFQRAHPLGRGLYASKPPPPLLPFLSRNFRCRRDKRKWPQKGGILLHYALT